ncbi:hypothetical protein [Streptomyces broussonetiae]|uniref:Uncharacterized protein n=1 Tax=Streptomyces broussonetiae TaxID=2686304 RepID=A0ABV5E5L5_9ACTN
MSAEIKLPVRVRVGETEACWGSVRVPVTDGRVDELAFRRELAAFLRETADALEDPTEDDEEVPDAAARG